MYELKILSQFSAAHQLRAHGGKCEQMHGHNWRVEVFVQGRELAEDGLLMDYENMGVLQELKGLMVGRPMRYTEKEKQQLRAVVLERTKGYTFPIVADMDFGHTSPQLTIPIGCRARINAEDRRVEVIDAAVA